MRQVLLGLYLLMIAGGLSVLFSLELNVNAQTLIYDGHFSSVQSVRRSEIQRLLPDAYKYSILSEIGVYYGNEQIGILSMTGDYLPFAGADNNVDAFRSRIFNHSTIDVSGVIAIVGGISGFVVRYLRRRRSRTGSGCRRSRTGSGCTFVP